MAAKKYIRVGVVKTKHKALLPLKVDDIFNSLGAREGGKKCLRKGKKNDQSVTHDSTCTFKGFSKI